MKHQKKCLSNWLLAGCCLFICLSCDDNYSDIKLASCDLTTEFIENVQMKVLLFKNEDLETIEENQKYITFSDEGVVLKYISSIPHFLYICNFPEELKGWNIPESGLPLLIKGRKHQFDGVVLGDRLAYYLELTYLKRL